MADTNPPIEPVTAQELGAPAVSEASAVVNPSGSATSSPAKEPVANPEDLKPLAQYVELEITAATARKSSFETRAFSIITVNLGLFTLFFAISTQLSIAVSAYPVWPKVLFITAVTSSFVSMACAVASAFPYFYPFPSDNQFDLRYRQAIRGKVSRHPQFVLKLRIFQLKKLADMNESKGRLLLISSVALGTAAGLIIATLTWVLLAG